MLDECLLKDEAEGEGVDEAGGSEEAGDGRVDARLSAAARPHEVDQRHVDEERQRRHHDRREGGYGDVEELARVVAIVTQCRHYLAVEVVHERVAVIEDLLEHRPFVLLVRLTEVYERDELATQLRHQVVFRASPLAEDHESENWTDGEITCHEGENWTDGEITCHESENWTDGEITCHESENWTDGEITCHEGENWTDGEITCYESENWTDGEITCHESENWTDGEITCHEGENWTDGEITYHESENWTDGEITCHESENWTDGEITCHESENWTDGEITCHESDNWTDGRRDNVSRE